MWGCKWWRMSDRSVPACAPVLRFPMGPLRDIAHEVVVELVAGGCSLEAGMLFSSNSMRHLHRTIGCWPVKVGRYCCQAEMATVGT